MRSREQREPEVIALASPAGSSRLELAEHAAAPPQVAARVQQEIPSAPPAAGVGESRNARILTHHLKRETKKSASLPVASSSSMRLEGSSAGAQPQNAPAEVAPEVAAPGVGASSALSGATATGRPLYKPVEPVGIYFSSPDRFANWHVGDKGLISRFANGTWTKQRSDVTADLLDGSAPSFSVCWIVGKSGTLLRTIDGGAHWTILKPPSQNDLIAVTATDVRTASITAEPGVRFTTHDGGVTWSSP
jgi:hypothetical protein